MRKRGEFEHAVAEMLDPAHEAGGARIQREREGEHGAQARGVVAEESAEGMHEGEEVPGIAG